MPQRHFYDLPVYRLAEDRYYAERDAYIEAVIFGPGTPEEAVLRERERRDPRANDLIRGHLQRTYGGCWRFNEVIGYIRLHFLGSQVQGEYYTVGKKRIVRTRAKTLEFCTWKLAAGVEVEAPFGTNEVLAAIRKYIADCRCELPKRVIDSSMFDVLAPHVDWAAVLKASRK
jgi:hypothetical protein